MCEHAETLLLSARAGRALPGFVSAGVIQQNQQGTAAGVGGAPPKGAAANPEELDLDMDEGGEDEGTKAGAGGMQQSHPVDGMGVDGGEEDEDGGGNVEVKAVPASLYGSLASAVGGKREESGEEPQGAMDRLKKRRVGQ